MKVGVVSQHPRATIFHINTPGVHTKFCRPVKFNGLIGLILTVLDFSSPS